MKSTSFPAITSSVLALTLGLRFCAASPEPLLQFDPDTISTCVEWFNNAGSDTCEFVREMFDISPDDFHKWNPSVGLDCKPWRWQSYCILTEERLSSITTTTTPTPTPEPTTTEPSHVPSPTSWKALGCYTDDDPDFPVLERKLTDGDGDGDASLDVSSCEDDCWEASVNGTVLYAGVKQGDQCWCGSFVGGQTSPDQTECDMPCSGDKEQICGGKERINVFEPITRRGSAGPTATATSDVVSTTQVP